MARSVYSNELRNRTNRLKLAIRKKPYKTTLAPNISLCYRRNVKAGTWSVEAGWLKRFAVADDYEDGNNGSVMTYYQASAHALKLARDNEVKADKPITVAQAIDAYEVDLQVRSGDKRNAIRVRNHTSPALLNKAVMLLTELELANWRDALVAKGLKPSSASRYCKAFKAALALASKRDPRIVKAPWKTGLKALNSGNPPRDNFFLPNDVILNVVRECYADSEEFGELMEVLAGTGAREGQVRKLRPSDVLDGKAPRLMMPCSSKGNANRESEVRAIPITPKLAKLLRARAVKRGANRPLFDQLWNVSPRFRVVLKRLGLDLTLTPYVLRHSSIIRQIRGNVPLRVIAFSHDTSVVEIERTYARYLNNASDDLTRAVLLADEAAPVDNVVSIGRG